MQSARVTSGQLPAMDADLEGYAWLPRMLAKARATVAGTASGFEFGCPVDHSLMARLGVAPELVLDLVQRHEDDAEVLGALRAHGIPSARDAWFDGQAVEDELQERGTYLRVRRRDALPEQHGARAFIGAEHGAAVNVLLIDAAPGKAEPWHRHPTEEVVAAQEGQATFFLGDLQRRIVRAGEVVRIPADVLHRYENSGNQGFRAVAAHRAAEVTAETPRSPSSSGTRDTWEGGVRPVLDARDRELLEAANFCHVATLRRDGAPHVVPVWVDVEADRIVLNSAEGRAWPRNLERDPRSTLTISNSANAYEYIQVRGRLAERTTKGADEHFDRLALKYLGEPRNPFRRHGDVRVKFYIQPETIHRYGRPD